MAKTASKKKDSKKKDSKKDSKKATTKKTTTKKSSKKGSKKATKKATKKKRPYYGIKDPVPPGFERATMQEFINKKKVNYFGIKKIDTKLIKHQTKDLLPNTKNELHIKKAGLAGKLNRLNKELEKAKTEADKESIKTEIAKAKDIVKMINQKLKTIK